MKEICCSFLLIYTLFPSFTFAQIDFSNIPKEFVRRKGDKLITGKNDSIVLLRGISFGNQVWTNQRIPETHHTESDYQNLKKMGMNVVRFYMNYQTFESDEDPYHYLDDGFEWLDKNIAWAKKNGIYLILNMHVPQGGFQSNGEGGALWDNIENRNRLKALYNVLAYQYRNEPAIIGFDLVNEPVTTKSIEQWKELAQQLCDEIRKVDRNHLIIVERLNAISGHWDNDENYNFFLIKDENTMYTFHFYSPIEYTHQNASWTSFGEGGKYPDETLLQFPSDMLWYECTRNNPRLKQGNSGWQFYEGMKFKINDSKILSAKPTFVSANNQGKVYFDDFIVKEYDENDRFIRDVYKENITSNSGWYFWTKDNSGSSALSSNLGHNDNLSVMITGTTDDANVNANPYRFPVKQGYSYSISGWMKGEDINAEANCMIRLDFETSPSGGVITRRDKDYLEQEVKKYLAFTKKHNVPVYCGEFGVINNCFREKGGLEWVNDMMDIFDKYQVHYTYHSYHEDALGLYYGYNTLPDKNNANTELITLFTKKLNTKGQKRK